MSRITVPEAEAMLGVKIPVLDKGYVIPVDYMGSDLRVVQSARISYGKNAKDDDIEGNRKIINYMMKNGHTSPFESVQLTYLIKLPIFVMRQHVRHRTAHLNEFSMRYSEAQEDDFFVPELDTILGPDKKNKQGRLAELDHTTRSVALDVIRNLGMYAYSSYKGLLDAGVARELARVILPVQYYTQIYWTIDLHNLFHYLKLRLNEHAQFEIRQYAQAIATFAKAVAPMSYEAFEEYVLYANTYSRTEILTNARS